MFSTYSTSDVSGVVCTETFIIDAYRKKLIKGQSNKKKYIYQTECMWSASEL